MLRGHARNHLRFYLSALLGVALWAVGGESEPALRLVLAGDGFFAAYLATVSPLALGGAADELRRRAGVEDVGVPLAGLLTLATVSLSLASIFTLLGQGRPHSTWDLALAVACVPL